MKSWQTYKCFCVYISIGWILILLSFEGFSESPVAAKHAMVVSEQKLASQAGLEMLQRGGNAIDAAVAVGYALAVVNPCCGNIGGGGFMTIHLANGKNIFINFREKAPLKATKNMYLDSKGNVIPTITTRGYLAVGVPGTVLGLETALKNYGTLTRQQVMAPAIRLAQQGYTLTPTEAKRLAIQAPDFRQEPNIAAIFLSKTGQAYKAGDRIVQHNLAQTLQQIADNGPQVFYQGHIAKAIVTASDAHHGILSLKDFADYTVEELSPVYCHYHGYTIVSAPPPSSGGTTLCEMLNILDNVGNRHDQNSLYYSAAHVRTMIEAMRYGFADRNRKLGDPDFISNPVAQLVSQRYAYSLSQKIRASYFAPWENPKEIQQELTDTTHYSVIDKQGNAVAVTYTIDNFFGAGVMAGNTGFFLNDEMDDFAAKSGAFNKFGLVQYDNNTIVPGKRPLSSMTPTIVLKNNQVFMVLGSPGGSRIITTVLLTLLNVIDGGMNIQQAVDAPRFHYQGQPDIVEVEPLALSFMTQEILKYRGYYINLVHPWSAVEAILVDPVDGTRYGANDRRRPAGEALGY